MNPIKGIAKRLAKWLLPHIIDEVQKEVERKANDPPPRPTLNRGER